MPEPAPDPATGDVARRCVTCAAPLAGGAFCPACGQEQPEGRLTLRGVLRRTVHGLTDLDGRFAYTLRSLFARPGDAVRDYLAGRTRRYVEPAKYVVILVAAATVATVLTAAQAQLGEPFHYSINPEMDAELEAVNDFLYAYLNVFMLLAVPTTALATRLLFRPARLNYAEHLVFSAYAFGQISLIYLLFVPLFTIGPNPAESGALGAYLAVIAAYWLYAAVRFFRLGWLRGALRGIVAMILAFVLFVVGFSLALIAYAAVRAYA